jgi:hypothetical protein
MTAFPIVLWQARVRRAHCARLELGSRKHFEPKLLQPMRYTWRRSTLAAPEWLIEIEAVAVVD